MNENKNNECTIKYCNGKWHCYSPDGKDMCAYTVKQWAVMFAESHGWIPISVPITDS